ncbi:hypothetical protein ACIGW8_06495 [Streptomyces sioyaensis]
MTITKHPLVKSRIPTAARETAGISDRRAITTTVLGDGTHLPRSGRAR